MSMSLSTAVSTPTVSAGTGRTVGTQEGESGQPAAFAALLQASVAAHNGGPGTGESTHESSLGDETTEEPETAPLFTAPTAAWGSWPTAVVEAGTTPGTGEGGSADGELVPDSSTDSTAVPAAPSLAEPQLPPAAIIPVGADIAAFTDNAGMPADRAGSDTAAGATITELSVEGAAPELNAATHSSSSAGESSPLLRAGIAGVVEGSQPVVTTQPAGLSAEAAAEAPAPAGGNALPASVPAVAASASPVPVPVPASTGAASVAPPTASTSPPAPGLTGSMPSGAVASAAAGAPAPVTPTDAAATSRQPDVSLPVPPVPVAPAQGMPAAPAAPVSPAPAAPPAPLAAQVAPTLFTLVGAKPGEHVLTINVAPDNLGPVTVRAHVTVDSLRVELFAPTDAGRDALRAIMPDLRRDLAGSGLTAQLDLSSENSASGQDPQKQRTPDARTRQPEHDSRGNAASEPRAHRASSASTIDVLA